jgi:modulator of FtsH protease HflC
MKSPVTGIAGLFVLFVVLIVGYSSVFTVVQTEQVLVVRLGDPMRLPDIQAWIKGELQPPKLH